MPMHYQVSVSLHQPLNLDQIDDGTLQQCWESAQNQGVIFSNQTMRYQKIEHQTGSFSMVQGMYRLKAVANLSERG